MTYDVGKAVAEIAQVRAPVVGVARYDQLVQSDGVLLQRIERARIWISGIDSRERFHQGGLLGAVDENEQFQVGPMVVVNGDMAG